MSTPAIVLEGLQPTFSCARTGARKAISDPSQVVAADTLDARTEGGIVYNGVANGGTNLVSSVLTDWAPTSAITISDLGGFIYELTFDGTVDSVAVYTFASSFSDRTANCQMRLASGAVAGDITSSYFGFRNSSVPKGSRFNVASLVLGADWVDVQASHTSADVSDRLVIRTSAGSAWTIQVRFMRGVDSALPHPAFPDGSVAGASHGTDICEAPYTANSTVETACVVIPYGWDDTTAFPYSFRVFSVIGAEDYQLRRSSATAWALRGLSGEASLASVLTAGEASVLFHRYNGTNKTLEDDTGATVTDADATNPTGTLRLGNSSTGAQPFHGEVAWLQYNRELTPEEHNIIAVWALTGVNLDPATGVGAAPLAGIVRGIVRGVIGT